MSDSWATEQMFWMLSAMLTSGWVLTARSCAFNQKRQKSLRQVCPRANKVGEAVCSFSYPNTGNYEEERRYGAEAEWAGRWLRDGACVECPSSPSSVGALCMGEVKTDGKKATRTSINELLPAARELIWPARFFPLSRLDKMQYQ